ncbi:MAG: protein kinase [Deltaproteobacteria bacterium]|nr:protein kinase [Deltaproteobacteria bacterium]
MSEGVPFGPYRLLRRLARGGMAEIFLARKDGPEGFSRTLVVKRILPHLVRDRAFVSMFLSEARIAALLAHPNVVHVYDFGEVDGSYYLAMEHVRGVDLRAVIDRAVELGGARPAVRLAHAVKMVSFVCEGLAHAHGLREGARSLGLVHRDVTPSNVLVSFDGAVKVADFGIAKVRQEATREETQAGIVKGKIAYLSPEQARGETLDRRSDLFNAGLLLYECFVGRPLLSPAAVERARRSPDDPRAMLPIAVSIPGAPEGLVAIVRRAADPDRALRYPDALSMRNDLEELLRELPETSGTVEIGAYVRELFGVEPSEGDALDLGMRVEPVGARTESRVAGGTRSIVRRDAGARTATAAPPSGEPRAQVTSTAIDGRAYEGARQQSRSAARHETALPQVSPRAEQSTATLTDEPPTELVSLAGIADERVPSGAHEGPTLTATVVEHRGQSSSGRLALVALASVLGLSALVAMVALVVTWASSSSTGPASAPADRPAKLAEPRATRDAPDAAVSGSRAAIDAPLAAPRPPTPVGPREPDVASLSIESTPSGATVSVDGESRGATPAALEGIAPGRHDVVVSLTGHVPSRIVVSLGPGERRTVQVALAAAPEPDEEPSARSPRPARVERPERATTAAPAAERAMGTLTIATNPSSEVFVGRRRLGWTPLRTRLPAGRHSLLLRARGRPERRTTVVVAPDGDARVRLTL